MTSASEFIQMMEDIAVDNMPCIFIVGTMTIQYVERGLVLVSTPSMRAFGNFLNLAEDGSIALVRGGLEVAQITSRVFEHVAFFSFECGHVYKAEAD